MSRTMSESKIESRRLYSNAAQVRARYGDVSDMWIFRRTRDDGFPAPIYFGGKNRFWDDAALDAWDARAIAAGSKRLGPVPPRKIAR